MSLVMSVLLLAVPGAPQREAPVAEIVDQAAESQRVTKKFMSALLAFFDPVIAQLGATRGYPGDFEILPSHGGSIEAARAIRSDYQRCMHRGIFELMGSAMRNAAADLDVSDMRALIPFFRTPEAGRYYDLLRQSKMKQINAKERAELERLNATTSMKRLLALFDRVETPFTREQARSLVANCSEFRNASMERAGFTLPGSGRANLNPARVKEDHAGDSKSPASEP